MDQISDWFKQQLSNPQLVGLIVVLVSVSIIVFFLGETLAPVIASVVLAYLLAGLVGRLSEFRVPRPIAFLIVYCLFIAALVLVVFGLLPLVVRQLTQLVQQVPQIIAGAQNFFAQLPEQYPTLFSETQINELLANLGSDLVSQGERLVSISLTSAVAAVTLLVYLILVPLLVFFMVRDQERILDWLSGFLPRERQLTRDVWSEVNEQLGNYVRGKVWEIILVGTVTFIVFRLLGLQYALLLAVFTGFSVLVPYVGAALVTIPVALVAFFQWGPGTEFVWVLVAYGVIQALDGNLLAPLLFSEVVNLHPVAIIVAILVFGGIWGFWGVFFAIPLATVVNAVIRAWPKAKRPPAAAEPAAS